MFAGARTFRSYAMKEPVRAMSFMAHTGGGRIGDGLVVMDRARCETSIGRPCRDLAEIIPRSGKQLRRFADCDTNTGISRLRNSPAASSASTAWTALYPAHETTTISDERKTALHIPS